MTIRRIRRTVVVEYVTDRADGDLEVFHTSGAVMSDTVDVVDADVPARIAQVEAHVAAGAFLKQASAMVDRQVAVAKEAEAETAAEAAERAGMLAMRNDPTVIAAELSKLDAELAAEAAAIRAAKDEARAAATPMDVIA